MTSKRYLFLVPSDDQTGWQVATAGGKVVTTDELNAFHNQPMIEAGPIFLGNIPIYEMNEEINRLAREYTDGQAPPQ